MPAADFGEWAIEGLDLTLGGRHYLVPPPSVAAMRQVLAAAVRGEVNLGLVDGPVPDAVQEVLNTIRPGDHPAISPAVYRQLVDDGVHPATIDRMTYYAVFYWARGKTYADTLARILWQQAEDGEDVPAPKG